MTSLGHLITAEQAAEIIGKTSRTVRRMADSGVLPIAHRLPGPNGAYLFARADVEALVTPSPTAGARGAGVAS